METEVATTFEASVVMKQQPDNVAILIESSEIVRSTASEQQPIIIILLPPFWLEVPKTLKGAAMIYLTLK